MRFGILEGFAGIDYLDHSTHNLDLHEIPIVADNIVTGMPPAYVDWATDTLLTPFDSGSFGIPDTCVPYY